MNNLTIGGWDERHGRPFAYYEMIDGGMGVTLNTLEPAGATHT